MKYVLPFALSVLFTLSTARADECSGKDSLKFSANGNTVTVTFQPTSKPPALAKDDSVSLIIGSTEYKATVLKVVPPAPPLPEIVELSVPPGLNPNLAAANPPVFSSSDAQLKTASAETVSLCALDPVNQKSQSFHVGPALSDESAATNSGAAPAADTSGNTPRAGALRFQFAESILTTRLLNSDLSKLPAARRLQTEFTVSIDTTDRKNGSQKFVDDNRVSAGVHSPDYSYGNILNRARIGATGEFAKAFHSQDRNLDLKAVLDGWLPFLQAPSFLQQTQTRTLPLSFKISVGLRSQKTSGVSSTGDIAEGSLAYHLYLLDHYRVALSASTLLNHVSKGTLATPRTQHSYKAEVFYAASATSKFGTVASYEYGHSGPVFTQLRQYFLGIGLQNLFGGKPE